MLRNTLSILKIFSLSAILLTAPAYAEPEIKHYGLIDFPTCIDPDGNEIKHYPGTSEQIVQFGGFLAAAGDFEVGKDGGIVNEDRIYYDESNMPYLPPIFQEFLFRHECAHVTLSHLDIPPVERKTKYWPIEQGADCQALADIKQQSSNFAQDAETILTYFNFIANTIMQNAPGSEEARKAFVDRRIENMRACPAFNQ